MENLSKPRVLVVDDTEAIIYMLAETLSGSYDVSVATDGKDALELVKTIPPDLILLDVMMPEMDGYEVCRRLKSDQKTKDIPVIFITALSDVGDETKGFELGAVDYITKPVSPPILLSRVKTHLDLYDQNRVLEEKVRQRTKELVDANTRLENSYFRTIELSFDLLNLYDDFLGSHCKRVALYSNLIAKKLAFEETARRDLIMAALLHDIGLAGFPRKETIHIFSGQPVSDNIMHQYQQHPLKSAKLLSAIERFNPIAKIITAHHEHMDGSGFPKQLAGDDIPLESRIIAVADRYDHISKMEKKGCRFEDAFSIMAEEDSTKYDSHILETLEHVLGKRDPFSQTVDIGLNNIKIGMTLAKPLINDEGVRLLSSGTRLRKDHIDMILEHIGKGKLKTPITIYNPN